METANRLLAREDERVSELIVQALGAEGIGVHCDSSLESVSASAGRRVVSLDAGDEIRCGELVVASGRAPRISGLSLENVGIEPASAGIGGRRSLPSR